MSSVDVIIPCSNYGHFLRDCAESALSQSGVDVRVLIIDDASPDRMPEVAAGLAVRHDDSPQVFVENKQLYPLRPAEHPPLDLRPVPSRRDNPATGRRAPGRCASSAASPSTPTPTGTACSTRPWSATCAGT